MVDGVDAAQAEVERLKGELAAASAKLAGLRERERRLRRDRDAMRDLAVAAAADARCLGRVDGARVDSVCDPCATAAGGVQPRGHVATCWVGRCDNCGAETRLFDVRDHRWPHGVPAGWRGSGRD